MLNEFTEILTLVEPVHALYALGALIGLNVCLLAAAAIALARFRGLLRRPQAFWQSRLGAELYAESLAAKERSRVLMNQVFELEDAVERLAKRVPLRDDPVARVLPFEHAARMARDGASVDELRRRCGLNLGEARLVAKLHGRETAELAVAGQAPL